MVWIVAYLIVKFLSKYKEKSILIAFLISLTYVSIDQSMDYLKDGKFFDQLLDFGVHLLGSVIAVLLAKYKMGKSVS